MWLGQFGVQTYFYTINFMYYDYNMHNYSLQVVFKAFITWK
jgi:hypothetical protein